MTSLITQTLTHNVEALYDVQIMVFNHTIIPGNHTSPGTSSSQAGLAVGLTLFFLLLAVVIGVIVYKYQSRIRNMFQPAQKKSQKRENYMETPQDDSHHYTSMISGEPTGQNPIYENLTTTTGHNRPAVIRSRFPGEAEEDVYLQCDSPDDAIYSNDLACNLSILPDSIEEDVYIVPDSHL